MYWNYFCPAFGEYWILVKSTLKLSTGKKLITLIDHTACISLNNLASNQKNTQQKCIGIKNFDMKCYPTRKMFRNDQVKMTVY